MLSELRPCTWLATDCSALDNVGGKALPRFSARRRIPEQALALKKYRGSIGPVSSIEESEDTPTSLGDRGGM
jgi:hypothetical protein